MGQFARETAVEQISDKHFRGELCEGWRIGAVPNHFALGLDRNAMTVWEVEDAAVSRIGHDIGALDFVTHAYHRPRRLPEWPYNLFAMLHGRTRAEVEHQAVQVQQLLGEACTGHDILYSTAILKKTGLRLKES